MLNLLIKPLNAVLERYLPDPFVLVLLLTALVMGVALWLGHASPPALLLAWGDGLAGLLSFSMQMMLVLTSGFLLASTALVRRLLDTLAGRLHSAGSALVVVTLVAMAASYLNWGFGLVVGAFFAKAVARRLAVDYRLLVASAYSGFIVWHGGLSGSVPLTIATPGHFTADKIGVVATSDTLFAGFNLMILLALVVVMPLLNYLMRPGRHEQVLVVPKPEPEDAQSVARLADDGVTTGAGLEHSRFVSGLAALTGLAYLWLYFSQGGSLNLNSISWLFLFLAIGLHQTPARLLAALQQGISGCSGILLQFPFYAGLMALMVQSGLAAHIAETVVRWSDADSLPLWAFLSAGLINIFIPSGGGQWAVQGPVMLDAALALGADVPKVAMAVAWGDAWTNLIQPFWALPVLAIAGLKAKDILGFCLLQLLVSGVVISVVLRWC